MKKTFSTYENVVVCFLVLSILIALSFGYLPGNEQPYFIGCILIAFIDHFQSREMAQSLSGRILFGISGKNSEGKIHKSEPEPRSGIVKILSNFLHQGKYWKYSRTRPPKMSSGGGRLREVVAYESLDHNESKYFLIKI